MNESFYSNSQFSFTVPQPIHYILGELVNINMANGNITYGQNYTPDAAAKLFWSTLSSEYKEFLKWKELKEKNYGVTNERN